MTTDDDRQPMTVKGMPNKARQRAKEHAERNRQTMAEWLTRAIEQLADREDGFGQVGDPVCPANPDGSKGYGPFLAGGLPGDLSAGRLPIPPPTLADLAAFLAATVEAGRAASAGHVSGRTAKAASGLAFRVLRAAGRIPPAPGSPPAIRGQTLP